MLHYLDKFTKFCLSKWIKKPAFPFKLNFAITYRCNFKCKICGIWKIYKNRPEIKNEELSLSEIKTFFKKAKFLEWISFTGGEPFLRDDLCEIIKAAYEKCKRLFIVNIPTNGFFVKKIITVVKEILDETNIPLFLIAINCSGTKKIHNALTNKDGSWEKAIKTFKLLTKIETNYSNFRVIIEYTLSKLNEEYFINHIKKLRKIGIDMSKVHINIFHTSSIFYHNTSSKLFLNSFSKENLNLFRRLRRGGDMVTIFSNFYLKLLSKNFLTGKRLLVHCFAGTASFFLDPFGNLYPCTILNKKICNLRDFNFNLARVVKSKRIREIRQFIKKNKCPGCFTPCEIYQNLILDPLRSIYHSL